MIIKPTWIKGTAELKFNEIVRVCGEKSVVLEPHHALFLGTFALALQKLDIVCDALKLTEQGKQVVELFEILVVVLGYGPPCQLGMDSISQLILTTGLEVPKPSDMQVH